MRATVVAAWLRRPVDRRRTLDDAMRFVDQVALAIPLGIDFPRLKMLEWVVPYLPEQPSDRGQLELPEQ